MVFNVQRYEQWAGWSNSFHMLNKRRGIKIAIARVVIMLIGNPQHWAIAVYI